MIRVQVDMRCRVVVQGRWVGEKNSHLAGDNVKLGLLMQCCSDCQSDNNLAGDSVKLGLLMQCCSDCRSSEVVQTKKSEKT